MGQSTAPLNKTYRLLFVPHVFPMAVTVSPFFCESVPAFVSKTSCEEEFRGEAKCQFNLASHQQAIR